MHTCFGYLWDDIYIYPHAAHTHTYTYPKNHLCICSRRQELSRSLSAERCSHGTVVKPDNLLTTAHFPPCCYLMSRLMNGASRQPMKRTFDRSTVSVPFCSTSGTRSFGYGPVQKVNGVNVYLSTVPRPETCVMWKESDRN